MDTSAPDIKFNSKGHCNYCEILTSQSLTTKKNKSIEQLADSIRSQGKHKPYDCIVGVSGGVDSSYTLHLVKELNLRPLAVHLDNGWNSQAAVQNIASLVRSLGVDLYTHVIDWAENKDLQRSMFAAHVIDIEMLMDNAMLATNYKQARKYGLKYILSGSNTATEGIRMPPYWTHCKFDAKNIRAIHKRFGSIPIRTHPLISTQRFAWDRLIRQIQWVSFLDYTNYNKDLAIDLLVKQHNYKPYPYKHYESVFTRFYQGYILPQKFGIDKRKVHFSSLIMTNQMKREKALELLKQNPYPDESLLRSDYKFVLKKLGFSDSEFKDYISHKPARHNDYPNEEAFFRLLVKAGKAAKISR